MNRWRLWIFRFIAITLVPLFLLILLEGGLRIIGFGFPSSFIVKCKTEGRKTFCENNQFGKLFFPPQFAREPRSFTISAHKPRNTYRIFVFGGSAAEGDPEPSYGFSRILQVMLQDQYPQVDFEVINLGMTAINSHVVYQIAKDIVPHKGDLFIIFLGNNEVVGPFGAGTVFSPFSPNLSFIRATVFIKSTRVGQSIGKLIDLMKGGQLTNENWGGMEMFLQNQLRADDPGLEQVYQHFRSNLEDILQRAKKNGTQTILSTVAVNLRDNAPFASLHHPDLNNGKKEKWETHYQSGIQQETQGNYDQAIEHYLEAAKIDDQFADLQYRLGQSFWALGKFEEARTRYLLARDWDALRFRADTKINHIIRSLGENRSGEGIHVLDADRLISENSLHGVPGNDLFYEHAHMNFKGNYLIASQLLRQIEAILPTELQEGKKDRPKLTEEEASGRLARTGYDRYRIAYDILSRTKRPPFTYQLYHSTQITQREKTLAELLSYTKLEELIKAAVQYREAIIKNPEDPWLYYNYAVLLENSENPQGAAELLKRFTLFLPQYYPAHEKIASTLIRQGYFDEAILHSSEALRIMPNFYPSAFTKAFALRKKGALDESIKILQNLSKLNPNISSSAYNQIGQIRVQQGDLDKAVEAFVKAIQKHESTQENIPSEIYTNLGLTLKQLGQHEKAFQAFRKAIRGSQKEIDRNPKSSRTHLALGRTFVEIGELEKAIVQFQNAVRLNPTEILFHLNLINAYEVQGRLEEGMKAAQEASKIMLNLDRREEAEKLQDYLQALNAKISQKE